MILKSNSEDPSRNYHLIIWGLRRESGCGYEIDQHIMYGQSMTIHSLDGTLYIGLAVCAGESNGTDGPAVWTISNPTRCIALMDTHQIEQVKWCVKVTHAFEISPAQLTLLWCALHGLIMVILEYTMKNLDNTLIISNHVRYRTSYLQ